MAALVDVTTIARAFLRGDADMQALIVQRVYAVALPAGVPAPDQGVLLLTAFNELSATPVPRLTHRNEARLQLEGFGRYPDDYRHARLIVATAADRLVSALPGFGHDEGVVTAVRDDGGLQPLPNNENNRPRWQASVLITAHPHVSVA